MTAQAFTHYGMAEIQGPPSSPRAGAKPLWRVVMSVPRVGIEDNVATSERPAQQEDRVHSVRTLLLGDVPAGTEKGGWRLPRLLSLHVVMGRQGNHSYDIDPGHDEGLYIDMARADGAGGASVSIFNSLVDKKPKHPDSQRKIKSVGANCNARDFHHIVAAPILEGSDWPYLDGEIRLPPLRLVEGIIELLVLQSEFTEIAPIWDSETEIIDPHYTEKAIRIRLTPDGIELPKAKAVFPGVEQVEQANLLVTPGRRGGIIFRLLPEQKKRFWLDRWRDAMPETDPEEEALAGFKIDARRGEPVPAFEWRPVVTSSVAKLPTDLFVPGADIGVRILSPADGTIAPVAELSPVFYRLSATRARNRSALVNLDGRQLLLSADLAAAPHGLDDNSGDIALSGEDAADIAGMRLSTEGPGASSKLRAWLVGDKGKAADHRCSYDDVTLAAMLRSAQRGPDALAASPPAAKGQGGGEAPSDAEASAPPLSGYVPLDDGWLQLPIANLSPLDLSRDSQLVGIPAPTRPNILSGFLRFAQSGERPELLSAADGVGTQKIKIKDVPWSLSLLSARAARLEIILAPGPSNPLRAAAVHFADPQLSTRGLIWISSDRPSAREALPRMSAGPTAYLDIALDTKGPRADALAIAISAFEISATRDAGSLVRRELGLSIAPGTVKFPDGANWPRAGKAIAPIYWQRHPVMPLAATMPMTRSARSSVYPLESRDLVPFVVHPDSVWTHLSWAKGQAFPSIKADKGLRLNLAPHSAWTWPVLDTTEADRGYRGVGLLAFGVPGWELRFVEDEKPSREPWSTLRSSLRFDIPGQDEAFATATTPPVPASLGPREAAPIISTPPIPAATSLDWKTLSAHWAELERRVSIARVVASRADGMTNDALLAPNIQTSAGVPAAAVTTLIGGVVWTTKLGFSPADGSSLQLPYGTGWIGDTGYRGDKALLGLSGTITIRPPGGANQSIELLGFSPVMPDEGGWRLDNRRMGWKRAEQASGPELDWRPLRAVVGNIAPTGLATLREPIALSWTPGAGPDFQFWAKDLAFEADGTAIVPGRFADFEAWSAEHLPLGSAEWRLYPHSEDEQKERFLEGREHIRCFGFELEPLQLLAVSAETRTPGGRPVELASIEIRCRIHLGAETPSAAGNRNLVTLLLKREKKGWQASIAPTALSLYLEPQRPGRLLRLDTAFNLLPEGIATFSESVVSLSSQTMVHQGAAKVSMSEDVVQIELEAVTAPKPKRAAFGLTSLRASVTRGQLAKLTFEHEITLMVAPSQGAEDATEPFSATLVDGKLTEATLLGASIKFTSAIFVEADSAISLSIEGRIDNLLTSRLPGPINLALAAGLDKPEGLWIPLRAGIFDAAFVADTTETETRRGLAIEGFALRAEGRPRTDDRPRPHAPRADESEAARSTQWAGHLDLAGTIDISNAIAWPVLKAPDPADREVHLPTSKSGRRKVGVDTAAVSRTHSVTYTLDDHRIDLHLANRVATKEPGAVWHAFALAHHRIGSGASERHIVATDAIAIGAASTLIPPFKDIDDTDDAVSFAGRYRDKITAGGRDSLIRVPGMRHTGVGTLATVFRGMLGRPFREAFPHNTETGLFLVGGALGLTKTEDQPSELVRLPVLAGLEPGSDFKDGHIQQRGDADYVVAWADSHAQRPIEGVWRGAATPASASERAIEAALISGSVTRWSSDAPAGRAVPSLLVEQYFANKPMPSDALCAGVIQETAFFIGAAIGVERLLALPVIKEADPTIEFLSLVAAPMPVERGSEPRKAIASLAAALRRPPLASRRTEPLAPPLLAVIGEDLVQQPWPADAAPDQQVAPEAIRRAAFQAHASPRIALLRLRGPKGLSKYQIFDVPARMRRRRTTLPSPPLHADSARGFPIGVPDGGWVVGSEEGAAIPVRDDGAVPVYDDGGNLVVPSGVAGLSRRVDLPAAALTSAEGLGDPSWYVQTRAPVYYSLRLANLASEPIPWLRTSPVRPRLPAMASIQAAWNASQLASAQPITPEEMVITSLGDRSGILTVRAAHVEVPAPAGNLLFDPDNLRFGRPGQAGPSLSTTDRPPRPGPIPENGTERYRRRRPCASPLYVTRPLDLVRGSTDVVRGREGGGWTATFVAAPGWDGIVTDAWDGTIELAVEVDVAATPAPPAARLSPAGIFKDLLGLEDPTTRNVTYGAQSVPDRARAQLLIDGAAIDYREVVLRWAESKAALVTSNGQETQDETDPDVVALRQRFTIWLDPSAIADRNPVIDAIGRAMSASDTLPSVMLSLTLPHPHGEDRILSADRYPLHLDPTIADVPQIVLPSGRYGLPTTLRFELFPLLRGRGALPLVPASAIFVDQSYDDGLASVPLTASERALPGPGDTLPTDRGELQVLFSAERARAQIGGTLALLYDLRFETRIDATVRSPAGGDMKHVGKIESELRLQLQPASGTIRDLLIGKPVANRDEVWVPAQQPTLTLGSVHQLDLSLLVETDGRPAVIADGDILVLRCGQIVEQVQALPVLYEGGPLSSLKSEKGIDLRVFLSAEPVVEPPPSTYAGMLHRSAEVTDGKNRLSLPLYALSPLPRRIDLADALAGFRIGLIERSATFVWTLARPRLELEAAEGIHFQVVKEERSGQSHRPDEVAEMVSPRSIAKGAEPTVQ